MHLLVTELLEGFPQNEIQTRRFCWTKFFAGRPNPGLFSGSLKLSPPSPRQELLVSICAIFEVNRE